MIPIMNKAGFGGRALMVFLGSALFWDLQGCGVKTHLIPPGHGKPTPSELSKAPDGAGDEDPQRESLSQSPSPNIPKTSQSRPASKKP
jgi:hypothetical protein